MKVYCSECKYCNINTPTLLILCECPIDAYEDNWYCRSAINIYPEKRNKNNDCKYYNSK